MVGFCGIVGDFEYNLDTVTDSVVWADESEHCSRYWNDRIDLFISNHQAGEASLQPVTTADGHQLCVWGDIIGFEGQNKYNPRGDNYSSDAEYCQTLFNEHGLSFVDGLNSEFAGVVIDESSKSATIFTDRLGARPIYYTECIDGVFLFSTHLNTILAHPSVEPILDHEMLVEFLSFERVLGTKTPFKNIEKLHPGSRLTYNCTNDSTSRTIYWTPKYRPMDKSYDEFVQEFTTLYHQAVEERRTASLDEGVLISGGSDSRLLLSILGSDVTGFHMNELMNTEAETAKEICDAVGSDFRFLERDADYQTKVLTAISDFQLFTSFFDQAHAVGFNNVLCDEVDAIFCGHYSDVVLSGHYLPKRSLHLPLLGWTVPIPLPKSIESIDEYLDYMFHDHQFTRNQQIHTQTYLRDKYNIKYILRNEIRHSNRSVIHHNVIYPSFDELRLTGGFYPLTNGAGFLFYYSLNQIAPTHYPYLDNRIIDLALSMPLRHQTSRNIVNASLKRIDPELANIPHSGTGLPLKYPQVLHTASELLEAFAEKVDYSSTEKDGSWSNHEEVIRESEIVSTSLLNNSSCCWNEIDPNRVQEIYEAHLQGEDHYFDLYALLSLCNSYPFSKSTANEEDAS
ncbi:hypothetical protein ACLI4R_00655 [Natrialbaceae archaeon A-chndr2]